MIHDILELILISVTLILITIVGLALLSIPFALDIIEMIIAGRA